jgi:hypothetical protein
MIINDSDGLASWSYTKMFSTKVPIDDLRDPLYSVNTIGKIQNTVRQANGSIFVNASNGDTSNLINHLSNSLYIASTDAPSFLMRFYNDSSASPYGIESLVDFQDFSDQDVEINNQRSVVDYLYFGTSIADVCNVQNMPSWFKITSSDVGKYQLTSLNWTGCS